MTAAQATVSRSSVTERAAEVIDQLRAKHGELLFHQSGGCCDGSAPMCLKTSDFRIGSRDVFLGVINGCEFYVAPDQFKYLRNMHITVDVTEGRGASFSLEIPLGLRFMSVSRLFSQEEIDALEAQEAS